MRQRRRCGAVCARPDAAEDAYCTFSEGHVGQHYDAGFRWGLNRQPGEARVEDAATLGMDDLLADAHLVRVMWSEDPVPCFRLVFLEKLVREQWADEGGWIADRLRVKARELVARGLKVDAVDCPANVAVYYDQAAVERLTRGDEVDRTTADAAAVWALREALEYAHDGFPLVASHIQDRVEVVEAALAGLQVNRRKK